MEFLFAIIPGSFVPADLFRTFRQSSGLQRLIAIVAGSLFIKSFSNALQQPQCKHRFTSSRPATITFGGPTIINLQLSHQQEKKQGKPLRPWGRENENHPQLQ